MSELLNHRLLELQSYLDITLEAPSNFGDLICDILHPLDDFIDQTAPNHLIVKDTYPWLVVLVRTYRIPETQSRLCVNFMSYLDGKTVRYMQNESRLRFDNISCEIEAIDPEARVRLYLSEIYPLSEIAQQKETPHRSLFSLEQALHDNRLAQREVNFLLLIHEIINSIQVGVDAYRRDELILLVDDFIGVITTPLSSLEFLKWEHLLVEKLRVVDSNSHQNKFILTSIAYLQPLIESSFLSRSLTSLSSQTEFMSLITLDFVQGLCHNIESSLLADKDETLLWESAISTFFSQYQDQAFLQY